ncbi:Mysoin-binding motif of peroxisomes-domain-containing protein [Lipomyces oligophaga]|uniref:Mysoin-binding motif of peroxisomes-domain-containing protein n=1 Tax=Lipomyces oligophaga TaxID=45792 RepID=UPI0034CDBC27
MASENSLFTDSPLCEYLNSAGEVQSLNIPEIFSDSESSTSVASSSTIADEVDNEIRTVTVINSEDKILTDQFYSRKNVAKSISKQSSSRKFTSGMTEFRPLVLGNESIMRKLRFQYLFSSPLQKRVGQRENNLFLERFRYILVTSQLLDEHLSNSAFHGSAESDLNKKFHHEAEVVELRKSAKYWVGSGGFVIVVAVLFGWTVKIGDRLPDSKYKLLMVTVLVVMVFLFFYAHNWRRRLRSTRRTALSFVSQFVKCNHAFDKQISRGIGLIQETEFISHGFKFPSSSGSCRQIPSRSTRESTFEDQQRCSQLRVQILSLLDLSLSLYRRSFDDLSSLCSDADLQKYFDIYDLNSVSLAYLDSEAALTEYDDDASSGADSSDDVKTSHEKMNFVFQLKQQFRKLHHTRRKVICCLLAMPSSGDSKDMSRWKRVNQHLESLADLIRKLTDSLVESLEQDYFKLMIDKCLNGSNERVEEDRFPFETSRRSNSRARFSSDILFQNSQSKWRSHQQVLNSMSASLRNIEAKMYILKEDSVRLENKDSRTSQIRRTNSLTESRRRRTGSPSNMREYKRASTGLKICMDSESYGSRAGANSLGTDNQLMDNIVKQYATLGTELHSLLKLWEEGRVKLYEATSSQQFTSPSPFMISRGRRVENDIMSTMTQGHTWQSPTQSLLSSPDSLISGTTFSADSSSFSPWSPSDTPSIVRTIDCLGDDGVADDEDADDLLFLETDGTPLALDAKSRMVDSIAAAIVRQQDRVGFSTNSNQQNDSGPDDEV